MSKAELHKCGHTIARAYRSSKVEMNFQEGQFMYAKRELVTTVTFRKITCTLLELLRVFEVNLCSTSLQFICMWCLVQRELKIY